MDRKMAPVAIIPTTIAASISRKCLKGTETPRFGFKQPVRIHG